MDDHGIRKMTFENFDFGAAHGERLHEQVVYQSFGRPPPCAEYPNRVKNR